MGGIGKVHGFNLSFLVNETLSVRVAKRSCILQDGENLNSVPTQKLIEKYGSSAVGAFKMVQNMWLSMEKKLKQLTIFGELFGGHYPHPDVPAVPNAKCQIGTKRHLLSQQQ